MQIEIEKIRIGKRVRQDLGDIASLAESMKGLGLLHPVVIDKGWKLIAGQRRLAAAKLLEWKVIDVRGNGISALYYYRNYFTAQMNQRKQQQAVFK